MDKKSDKSFLDNSKSLTTPTTPTNKNDKNISGQHHSNPSKEIPTRLIQPQNQQPRCNDFPRQPAVPFHGIPIRYPRTPVRAYNDVPRIPHPHSSYSANRDPEAYQTYPTYQEPTRYSNFYYGTEYCPNRFLPSQDYTPRNGACTNADTNSNGPYPRTPISYEYGLHTQMESLIEPSEEEINEDSSFFDEYTMESDAYPYNPQNNEFIFDEEYASTPENTNRRNRGVVCKVKRTPQSIKMGEDLRDLFISINNRADDSIDANEINLNGNQHENKPSKYDLEPHGHPSNEVKSPLILGHNSSRVCNSESLTYPTKFNLQGNNDCIVNKTENSGFSDKHYDNLNYYRPPHKNLASDKFSFHEMNKNINDLVDESQNCNPAKDLDKLQLIVSDNDELKNNSNFDNIIKEGTSSKDDTSNDAEQIPAVNSLIDFNIPSFKNMTYRHLAVDVIKWVKEVETQETNYIKDRKKINDFEENLCKIDNMIHRIEDSVDYSNIIQKIVCDKISEVESSQESLNQSIKRWENLAEILNQEKCQITPKMSNIPQLDQLQEIISEYEYTINYLTLDIERQIKKLHHNNSHYDQLFSTYQDGLGCLEEFVDYMKKSCN